MRDRKEERDGEEKKVCVREKVERKGGKGGRGKES